MEGTRIVKLSIDLSNAEVGDLVVRALGGSLPMNQRIAKVENGIITTIPDVGDDSPLAASITAENGWTFDQLTGMEIDDYLKWGPKHGQTGSYLTHLIK